ncbi:regulator of chromosome condensation, putative [Ichthyophthirius multifiliis]|uniref:Regulator of chromosome condensation, putative n=1 Tax=Ichthyophthirius multifiliis TaxID=5932 RepID=G0QJE7_ICHMU|nr:regulator of chromosome condensation, putative [Ichthyophthirius multifiliis]EGR34659.1 regulator of chromosome condensation, putative [Ichthyophthirius multifiliis]|eukprot:XP_004039963.1 regulator of chromosome condensation, putative [Ichthyophthirius multifiliis]
MQGNLIFLQLMGVIIAGIACNQYHCLVWDIQGRIFSWGNGLNGQLGHPIDNGYSFNKIEYIPKQIAFLKDKKIIQASCGIYYSTAITNEGLLYGWGKGVYCKEVDNSKPISLMDCLMWNYTQCSY